MERSDYPIVLQVKHIQSILGFSKSTTYEVIRETGFPLLLINGRKIAYRDAFFEWLDSKQAETRDQKQEVRA